MGEAIISRLRMVAPGHLIVLASAFLILLAIAAAELVSEATFRLLSDVEVAQVQLAVLATAALVATPIAIGLVQTTARLHEEKRRLALRADLLSAAHSYAKLGHWEFDAACGQFILSDALHHLLGDPDKTLQLSMPDLLSMANPEDRERLAAAFQRVLADGAQESVEYRITGLDGKE